MEAKLCGTLTIISQLDTSTVRRTYCVNVKLNIPYLVVITGSKEVISGLLPSGTDRLNCTQFSLQLMGSLSAGL